MESIALLHKQAEQIEPEITANITKMIYDVGGKPAGLEHRLKSLLSLESKIKVAMLAGISEKQAIENTRDIIRYTAIFENNTFVEQYNKMQALLIEQNYHTLIVKNTWQSHSVYKGVNTFVSAFIEKDNVIFEVQYHTQQSFELKNGKLHKLYELFRNPETSQQEKAQLFLEMQRLSANLDVPKNINLIKGTK